MSGKKFVDLYSMTVAAGPVSYRSMSLGTMPFVAGMIDKLGLQELIDELIGKEGSHVAVSNGEIASALIMQMLNVPYQTLTGTSEYFENIPIGCLLKHPGLQGKDLGRAVLSRFLDSVYEYGSERLFLSCAFQTIERLNIKVKETHIDSTSFHYDGDSYKQEDCPLEIKLGYSRDHRPDLKQAISVMIADGGSRIPLCAKNVSGNINDKKSFFDITIDTLPTLQGMYKDLKYVVGDSSLCTENNINSVKTKGLEEVSRLTDSNKLSKACFEYAKQHEEQFEPVFPNEEDGQSPLGMWCEDCTIGGNKVKRLLVSNGALREKKTKTITKKAQNELIRVSKAFEKLENKPCKCQPDAQKAVESLLKKLNYCKVENISYEDVYKRTRGRPKKDGSKPKEILEAVKVHATVSLNEEIVKQAIEQEMMYVIITTDTERDWTMAELLGTYKRQSVIERSWRVCKDPRFFVDSIYLKKPSRIDALLWLMSLALLVYSALEYYLRHTMQQHGLTIRNLEGKGRNERPTLMRFFQYVFNNNLTIVGAPNTDILQIPWFDEDLQNIIRCLGFEWTRYFNIETYRGAFDRMSF